MECCLHCDSANLPQRNMTQQPPPCSSVLSKCLSTDCGQQCFQLEQSCLPGTSLSSFFPNTQTQPLCTQIFGWWCHLHQAGYTLPTPPAASTLQEKHRHRCSRETQCDTQLLFLPVYVSCIQKVTMFPCLIIPFLKKNRRVLPLKGISVHHRALSWVMQCYYPALQELHK